MSTSDRRGDALRSSRRAFLGAVPALAGCAGGARPSATPTSSAAAPIASGAAPGKKRTDEYARPPGVAYRTTGTLGASPKRVTQAVTNELVRLERELADYDYFRDREPPLTGYHPWSEFRNKLATFCGAS